VKRVWFLPKTSQVVGAGFAALILAIMALVAWNNPSVWHPTEMERLEGDFALKGAWLVTALAIVATGAVIVLGAQAAGRMGPLPLQPVTMENVDDDVDSDGVEDDPYAPR